MKIWIRIFLLCLPIYASAAASLIEFSYTRNFVSFGTGSLDYDSMNPASAVSEFELDGVPWDSVQYSSFISNDSRVISVQANRGNSLANILLTALDINFPAYPAMLVLDDFESGRIVIGNRFNPAGAVYTIASLGNAAAIPLPASLWLFVSGLAGLAFKLKSCS